MCVFLKEFPLNDLSLAVFLEENAYVDYVVSRSRKPKRLHSHVIRRNKYDMVENSCVQPNNTKPKLMPKKLDIRFQAGVETCWPKAGREGLRNQNCQVEIA